MTKYATLSKYQPYIDVVMDDLGLTGKVAIRWVFGQWERMGGDSILYETHLDGRRYGVIRVDKRATHDYVIQTIMHELKHIQQYYNKHLSNAYLVKRETRYNIKYEWYIKWYNVEYKFYGTSKNTKLNNIYKEQPWEKEAYTYQETYKKLFPNGDVYKLVGKIGTVAFYKKKG